MLNTAGCLEPQFGLPDVYLQCGDTSRNQGYSGQRKVVGEEVVDTLGLIKVNQGSITAEVHHDVHSQCLTDRDVERIDLERGIDNASDSVEHASIVTAQKPLADSMQTHLQPSKTVTKKAENEGLPVENEQLPSIFREEKISPLSIFREEKISPLSGGGSEPVYESIKENDESEWRQSATIDKSYDIPSSDVGFSLDGEDMASNLFYVLVTALDSNNGAENLKDGINLALENGILPDAIVDFITIRDQGEVAFYFNTVLDDNSRDLKIIENYLDGISSSNLDSEFIVKLFECKHTANKTANKKEKGHKQCTMSAFSAAMGRGNQKFVKLFMRKVFACEKINIRQVLTLLRAVDSFSRPALFKAMTGGFSILTQTYCDLVCKEYEKGKISKKNVVKALSTTVVDNHKNSGLFSALELNHKEVIEVYGQAVNELSEFPMESKKKLLKVRNPLPRHSSYVRRKLLRNELSVGAYQSQVTALKKDNNLDSDGIYECIDSYGVGEMLERFNQKFLKKKTLMSRFNHLKGNISDHVLPQLGRLPRLFGAGKGKQAEGVRDNGPVTEL